MFTFKLSLLLILLAVQYNGSNANFKAPSELELEANENLETLYETVGADQDREIQDPLHEQDNKCDGNAWCWNGGTCDSGICKCPTGTSGPFCEKIAGCENAEEQTRRCGNPDNVYCAYNVTSQKPYCRCANLNFLYDPHYKVCKECYCGFYGKCSFVNGKKTCLCQRGFGLFYEDNKEKYCESCYSCGIYSEGCEFHGFGKQTCFCRPRHSQKFLNKCSECDCGAFGNCTFDFITKKCQCDDGFVEKDGTCEMCDCGPFGTCGFDDDTGEKKCNCAEGHGVRNGICVECDCFMDNNRVNCTFLNGKKKCSCPDGFEENNSSNCTDINECMNETACPPNSVCTNTYGSYECTCETGFRPSIVPTNATESPNKHEEKSELDPKVVGCEDINECMEPGVCTHNETTTCINTIGSYKCLCKEGFSIPPYKDSAEDGCRKSEGGKSYKTVYIVLSVLFGIIILGIIVFFVRKRYRR